MTDTTQPDPQVVAAAREHIAATGGGTDSELRSHIWSQGLTPAYDVPDASIDAARKPLTVADVPAGQGPASLFLAPDGHGDFDLCFKYADGHIGTADIELGTLSPTLIGAFREHLAATLPHVTVEEN